MPRPRPFHLAVAFAAIFLGAAGAFAAEGSAGQTAQLFLHKNWLLQSSCEVKATGEQLSTPGFDASAWHHTDLPSTVVGALVNDKTYPDPTYGTNLRSLPGMDYSSKSFFALQDMPKDSPFLCSWSFRTEFTLPSGDGLKTKWLHFLGINYRANIWLNGQKIADAKDVAGTFETFEFNVSTLLHSGKPNALAVEIFAPGKNDLGITWVDWNPTPADKDMGIWKEVFLTSSDDVTLRNPFVASKLDAEYKTATLTVSADLHNSANHPVNGVLRAEIEGTQISQPVTLAAGETKAISFTPEQFAQLKLANPRIWGPYQMGEPNLYTAKLSFEIDKQASDSAAVTFGI